MGKWLNYAGCRIGSVHVDHIHNSLKIDVIKIQIYSSSYLSMCKL